MWPPCQHIQMAPPLPAPTDGPPLPAPTVATPLPAVGPITWAPLPAPTCAPPQPALSSSTACCSKWLSLMNVASCHLGLAPWGPVHPRNVSIAAAASMCVMGGQAVASFFTCTYAFFRSHHLCFPPACLFLHPGPPISLSFHVGPTWLYAGGPLP